MVWQVQEAKQRFSEMVRKFRRSRAQREDLAEFLLSSGPDFDLLDLERSGRLPRTAELRR